MKKSKLLIYLCTLIITFSIGMPIKAADANDIIVDAYSVDKSTISEGTEFNLTFSLKKISGGAISDATLSINPGSFTLKNTGSVISINPANLNAGQKETITLPLKCSGVQNTIELTLNYKEGGTSKQAVNSITIDMIKPSVDASPSTPTNTQKYNPDLSVVNQTMPAVTAGSKLNLELELQNLSTHRAKTISVELVPPSGDFYYESNTMSMINHIKEIKSKGKVKLNYSLNVLSATKAKTYIFQLRYKYFNAYGDEKSKTQDIHIKVKKGVPDIKLAIADIKTTEETLYAGEETTLSFLVNNNAGIASVKHIEASLQGLSQEGFSIVNGVNSQTIYNLSPATEGKMVTFNLYASEKMTTGNYPLKVRLKYQDSQNNEQTIEEEVYIRVAKKKDASLEVMNITTVPSVIDAGKEGQMSFVVKNTTQETMKNVKVQLKGLSAESINLVEGINSQMITELTPQKAEEKVVFNIYASEKLGKGSYPLTIHLAYQDAQNVERTLEREVFVRVDLKKADIIIKNVNAPKSPISDTKTFNVSFDLVNQSKIEAKDLTVSVKSADSIVPVSQNVQLVKSLAPGAGKKLSFKLQATSDAKTKNHLLNIEIKGKDEQSFTTINQYVGIYVNKDQTTGKPNIIVDSYATTPTIVNAGQNFELNISLNNTHKTKKVQNVKVFLTAEDNTAKDSSKSGSVFTPVNSSNTFFIDEILPKESMAKKLTLYTIPYAPAKTHTIKVNLEYEDDKGVAYTATELISVPVIQTSSFITSDINIPETMTVEQPHSLNLEISNTGKTTLDNFTVLVEGFGASNTRGYIGNLESGRTTYHKVDVWPLEAGKVSGNIIFTYTKPNGAVEEVKKEITTTAEAIVAVSADGMMDEEGNMMSVEPLGAKGGLSPILIILIVGVIGAVATVIVVRRIKKKRI